MTEPFHRSLASFDPRFAELLLRGGREAFELQCESESQAYRLQMRIQQFRKRAFEAKVESSERFYDCVVSLNRKKHKLMFRPRTSEFGSVLDNVASTPASLNSDPLDVLDEE